jgi:hypothetical protein
MKLSKLHQKQKSHQEHNTTMTDPFFFFLSATPLTKALTLSCFFDSNFPFVNFPQVEFKSQKLYISNGDFDLRKQEMKQNHGEEGKHAHHHN